MAARVKGPLEGAIEDYTAYIKASRLGGLRFVTRDEVGTLTESALYKPVTAAVEGDMCDAAVQLRKQEASDALIALRAAH
eukprot:13268207-Heterocapsa_arctica.AAC.1